jgi:hypothetical protein
VRAVGSAVSLIVLLAAASLPTLVGSSPALAACASLTRPDAKSATALAKTCDKPVLIASAHTDTTTVVANTDGSFTSTEWAVPHWVLKADGTWRTVDTTLQTNVDGSVSPVASPNPVTLSGGGNSILAKQVSNQQELVWSWPAGRLSKPRLSGPTATYSEVFPGRRRGRQPGVGADQLRPVW